MIQRLKTCIIRIQDYLSGKIDKISELEEELILKDPNKIIGVHYYKDIISKGVT